MANAEATLAWFIVASSVWEDFRNALELDSNTKSCGLYNVVCTFDVVCPSRSNFYFCFLNIFYHFHVCSHVCTFFACVQLAMHVEAEG